VLTAALPPVAVAAFAALVAAMVALWAPRLTTSPGAATWWVIPFGAALVLALGSDFVDTWGLAALFVFVTACRLIAATPDGALRGFAIAVVLAASAGFMAHALPGFTNPRVLDGVRLSADSLPYTKFMNFDKGAMGLLLLGLVAPPRAIRRSRAPTTALLWRFGVAALVVMAATVAVGYARWDPKLPEWWPLWLWTMVFLTALPEEALFRHLIQGGLEVWLGGTMRARWMAMAAASVVFGLAHAAGGVTYVVLATLAGLGYGWIYAVSGSVTASILAHTGLNLLHLLFFSYPALQGSN
jgi:membrane protease YdiL (CAAX protease family)